MLWGLHVFMAASAILLASAGVADQPVVEFDFYRAMSGSAVGAYAIQNFNLASIAGVSKYIHTEVIAEHVTSDPERKERKNGIDTIARLRVKVKNPSAVLASAQLATQVDFGPFVTFDNGIATNPRTQEWIQRYGSFVGAQQQTDVRWPSAEPYFWFSLTGWCPNVHYSKIPMPRQEAATLLEHRSLVCVGLRNRAICEARASECIFEAGVCVARDPAPECLNYTAASGSRGHVLGGLCPGGTDNLSVEPTGELGCTYSYGHASEQSLDSIVGVVDEDCGGRLCTDWLDFRLHCSNPAYRRKFDIGARGVVDFKYCVEYDVHPFCEADCRAPACQQLPEAERELGLPFWRGKCSARANGARTEMFGRALRGHSRAVGEGIKPAGHGSLSSDAVVTQTTCVRESPGLCTPLSGQGGNFFTRRWGGVCYNCYIPGTSARWPATHMPFCPYKVLQHSDYWGRFLPPTCRTSLPRDLCCLYTGDCSAHDSDASNAPIDEDGFAVVASWEDSKALATFLQRAIARNHSIYITTESLGTFARSLLAPNPRKGASLQGTLDELVSTGFGALIHASTSTTASSTTTTSSTTITARTATNPLTPALAAAEQEDDSRSSVITHRAFGASVLFLVAFCVLGLCRLFAKDDAKDGKTGDENTPQIAKHTSKPQASEVLDASLPRLLGRSLGRNSSIAQGFDVEKGGALDILHASADHSATLPAPQALGASLPRLLGRSSGRCGNCCSVDAFEMFGLGVKQSGRKASGDTRGSAIEEDAMAKKGVDRPYVGVSEGVLPSFAANSLKISKDAGSPWGSEESEVKDVSWGSVDSHMRSEGSSIIESRDAAELESTSSNRTALSDTGSQMVHAQI